MSVNKVILIGNLGGDPNMRYTSSGTAMANFSLATTDYRADRASGEKKERAEWHRLVAFGRTAEIISQYCRKGSKIYVEGRLQTRSWTDQQSNQLRYTTEIIIDNMQLLSPKGSGGGGASYDDGYGAAPAAMAPAGGNNYNNNRGGFPNNEGFNGGQNFGGGPNGFGGGNNFANDLPAGAPQKNDDGFDNDSDIPF